MLRRSFVVLLMVCLGCSAQAPPAAPANLSTSGGTATPLDITQVIERQIRAHYQLPAEIKLVIGPLRASDFPNYDALTVIFDSPEKKTPYEFLLSHDHTTLIRMTKLDLTKDPYAEVMKKIDTTGRPTRGNKDAKVVVVNYDDFQCPFCSKLHATLFPEILKEYGDRVLFIYKDYPLEQIHPWSVHAAVNANCLNAQSADAYWDYADFLHNNQRSISAIKNREGEYTELDKLALDQGQKHNLDASKLQACVKAQDEKPVRASLSEGDSVGVDATPTLFVNGEKLDGAVPADDVRAALNRALSNAGVKAPEHKSAPDATKAPSPSPSK